MPVRTKQFNFFEELPDDLLLPVIEGSMKIGQRLAGTNILAMPFAVCRFSRAAPCLQHCGSGHVALSKGFAKVAPQQEGNS